MQHQAPVGKGVINCILANTSALENESNVKKFSKQLNEQ